MWRNSILATNHEFRRLWAAELVSNLGMSISMIALPLVALMTIGATPLQVGLLAVASTVPHLLFGLPAGVWVDRLPKKQVMLLADLTRAALLVSVPGAAWLGLLTIEQLYLVAAASAVCNVFYHAAKGAYVALIAGSDGLVKGYSMLETGGAVTNIVGPGLAGPLIQAVTAPVALLLDAASFLSAAFLRRRIRLEEPTPSSVHKRAIGRELTEGLRLVTGERILRLLLLSTSGLAFFNVVVNTMIVVWLTRDLHQDESFLGILYAVAGVLAFAVSLVAPAVTQRMGVGAMACLAALISSTAALLIPLGGAYGVWMVVAANAVAMGTGVAYRIAQMSMRQQHCPAEIRGRMNATFQVAVLGAVSLGALAGGLIAQISGVHTALWVGGAGQLAIALLLVLSGLWRRPTVPSSQADLTPAGLPRLRSSGSRRHAAGSDVEGEATTGNGAIGRCPDG